MLASMVGFLCCSFKSFEAVEVDRVLQSSAILKTVFACIRKATAEGLVARLSSNVRVPIFVSASPLRPRTQ